MKRQRGAALFVALISLTTLLFASLAMMRSTDTTTAIAGNMAFKQAATQAADMAMQAAALQIQGFGDPNTSVANQYSATQLAVDAYGIPTVNWASIPTQQVGLYAVQRMTDRLCVAPLPVANVTSQCFNMLPTSQASSRRIGAQVYNQPAAVYYRVTARVVGPKQSESYVQTLLTR